MRQLKENDLVLFALISVKFGSKCNIYLTVRQNEEKRRVPVSAYLKLVARIFNSAPVGGGEASPVFSYFCNPSW